MVSETNLLKWRLIPVRKAAVFIGIVAGASSMILWILLNFFNPYSQINDLEPMIRTFFLLALPAFLAISGAIKRKPAFVFIAFIWSFPISFYLAFTAGIFVLFSFTSVLYLISFLLMRYEKKKEHR